MSARAASAPGAGVLDRLQVLRSAPTPLRGAPAATWTPSPRTGVGPLRVPGPGLQPSSHDTTTTRTDPAGSTLARPDFGPKDGVHLTFGPWKGIADLLDAFLTIHTRMKSAQLVLCGEGSLASDVRRFTKEHALEKDVVLPGHIGRDSLTSYYQACDVFVLPSLTEGAGNVLLEAAACGRPTVGTRAGGIPDYIVDGETGYLCEKRNAADLAEKIEKILRDPGLVDSLGKNGLARVREHFRYDQMVDKIIAAYTQVTERVS